jgi:hypothetical protein
VRGEADDGAATQLRNDRERPALKAEILKLALRYDRVRKVLED